MQKMALFVLRVDSARKPFPSANGIFYKKFKKK